jgi:hypothetical protein
VVEVGPRRVDEGVEQAPQFGHGQRDELLGSGCGSPFSAVARVALDALILLPGEQGARGLAAEARPVFEKLRARPYLERLEAELAGLAHQRRAVGVALAGVMVAAGAALAPATTLLIASTVAVSATLFHWARAALGSRGLMRPGPAGGGRGAA